MRSLLLRTSPTGSSLRDYDSSSETARTITDHSLAIARIQCDGPGVAAPPRTHRRPHFFSTWSRVDSGARTQLRCCLDRPAAAAHSRSAGDADLWRQLRIPRL